MDEIGTPPCDGATAAAAPPPPAVRIEVDADPRINWALEHNGVPVVREVRVVNDGPTTLRDVSVEIVVAPKYSAPKIETIASIPPGAAAVVARPDVRLDGARLRSTTERARATLVVVAKIDGVEVARAERPTEVLARNEWNAAAPPELLAAFVTPNLRGVARVLREARDLLRETTPGASFDGYESRSPARVRAMAEAIYRAVQRFDVGYVPPPASFESDGQKIRTPDDVLDQRLGSCLDLSVFFAACLEQAGLHPLILTFKGHAVPAVRTTDEAAPDAVIDDAALMRKLALLREILPIEATLAATKPPTSFADAVGAAEDLLHGNVRAFEEAIDVRAARRLGILPLPFDAATSGVGVAPPSGVASEPERVSVAAAAPPPFTSGAESAAPRVEPRPRTRVDAWKEQLLDLSLRNKLLNFKEQGRLVVPLHGDDLSALEDLVAAGDAVEIAPEAAGGASSRDATLAAARGARDQMAAERLKMLREGRAASKLPEADLLRRATLIAREAKAEIAETGGSSLYLALGALRWFESDAAEEPRTAPLLLVPATIDRPDGRGRVLLRATDDETRFNPALIEKMRLLFGVDLGALEPPPADASGVDVRKTLDDVGKAFARHARFEVVPGAWIAFLAFSKFLLWRDLDAHADALLRSPHVARLARLPNAPPPESSEFPEPEELEAKGLVDSARLVLDADSSQHAAVAAALAGKSFVLQGPPGTGKSQTIANIIAGTLAEGRRVLFVAEKRAALDVVARRLRAVGLADACLELHTDASDKRAVAVELARTIEEASIPKDPDVGPKAEAARRAATPLRAVAEALHAETPLGVSVFEAHVRALRIEGAAPLRVATEGTDAVDAATFAARLGALEEVAAAAADVGDPARHPFAASAAEVWTPLFAKDVEAALRAIPPTVDVFDETSKKAARILATSPFDRLAAADAAVVATRLLGAGIPAGAENLVSRADREACLARLDDLARSIRAFATTRADLETRWTPALFDADLDVLASDYRRNADAFAPYRWFALRTSRGVLKAFAKRDVGSPESVSRDLEAALGLRARRASIEAEGPFAEAFLGAAWRGATTTPEAIENLVAFVGAWTKAVAVFENAPGAPLLAPPRGVDPAVAGGVAEELSSAVAALRASVRAACATLKIDAAAAETATAAATVARERAASWLEDLPKLRGWTSFVAAEAKARAVGLSDATSAARRGEVPYAGLRDAYERAFLDAWLDRRLSTVEGLKAFDGRVHDRLLARFAEADRAWIGAGGRGVAAKVAAARPERDSIAPAASEAGVVLAEARKKRRHLPVRRLFERIPNLLPRLKPCLLANPSAVARYLPPEAPPFDLVVFDEASQIPTADAVGSIARGRSVIVVGDGRQLPPTAFFETGGEDDARDDAEIGADLESVLDDMTAARAPSTTLRWHYRSRDESLIAFSNGRYYDGRLRTFPGAGSREAYGVALAPVRGVFDRARTRTNRAEAEAVVAEIAARLTDPSRRDRSIGVVTFNQPQRRLIEDLLDQARADRPEIEPYFGDAAPEPVFVKNLENVQGDERDVMLFSTTFGPDADGRITMNFGPLNRAGGERRLNVAITRARERLLVFSSLRPEDVDLARTSAVGAAHLKAFLRYAAEGAGRRVEAGCVAEETTTDFERDVAAALRRPDRVVDVGVGLSDVRVDVAVRDPRAPERYLLGILCDGRGYRDAATTRDRDRLRSAVLERLGWRLERVWTPDWRANREAEAARLEEAVAAALRAPSAPEPPGANVGAADAVPETPADARPAASIATSSADADETPTRADAAPLSPSEASKDGVDRYVRHPAAKLGGPDDLHAEGAKSAVVDLAEAIVRTEGPVHREPVVRAVAAAYGIGTLGARVKARIEDLVDAAASEGRVVAHGEFLWRLGDEPATFDRVREPSPGDEPRDVEHVAPEELAAAARRVLAASTALPFGALVKATAAPFGVRRSTSRVRAAVSAAVDILVARSVAARDSDVVRYRESAPPASM